MIYVHVTRQSVKRRQVSLVLTSIDFVDMHFRCKIDLKKKEAKKQQPKPNLSSGKQTSELNYYTVCLAEEGIEYNEQPATGLPSKYTTPVDSIGHHKLLRINGRKRRCRNCIRTGRKTQSNRAVETTFFCNHCKVALCRYQCFENFHSK